MIAVGLATGCTVRIGQELSRSARRGKQIAAWCMGFAILVGAMLSFLLHRLRIPIVRLFTNDESVLQVSKVGASISKGHEKSCARQLTLLLLYSQGCEAIWGRVCAFVFILYVFAINRAILRALGMQWRIAAVVVPCVWCGALPAIVFKAVYLKQGLDAVWTILPFFYFLMQVLLILSYASVNWKHISNSIRNEMPIIESKDVEMESLNSTR